MTIKRKAPLTMSAKPIKRSPIKKKSGKPKRFAALRNPAYCEWIRTKPCLISAWASCAGRIEVAHVQSRGAGGGDIGNVVPLCARHHREQHTIGLKSFERQHVTSLADMALVYKNMWHWVNPEVLP